LSLRRTIGDARVGKAPAWRILEADMKFNRKGWLDRKTIAAGIMMLLAVLATSGCGKDTKAAPPGPQAMPVKVHEAQAVPVNETSDYVATLKSRDSAVIIDPLKQQATVKNQQQTRDAQRADLEYAQQQYQRASGLYQAGVVSKQDFDQAKSNLDAAKAKLDALDASVNEQQVQLHYYKVTAPSSGIVGDIPVHVGDRVTTSTVLTTVDKPGSLEVYIYVPIEKSSQLRMNMPVEILDGEGNVVADSRVSFISPQVDSTTQTVLVKARIANSKDTLRQLQFIRARVVWGTEKSPVVPILAVSRIGGQYFAFIAEKDSKANGFVARQKPLKVGQTVDNNYVVLEGVKPGDKVIVSGTQFLVDGAPVVPQTEAPAAAGSGT
jgi:RND family efflux transporter MFP subunit